MKSVKRPHVPGDVELASGFRVSDYDAALADAATGREKIADAIHRRFTERYLEPVTAAESQKRHGFTMMAVACLMIEALQSFRRGWTDTKERGKGELAFCSFFADHDGFALFRPHGADFYAGVRCGILHQAETTKGWTIRRDQDLMLTLTPTGRVIDARLFVEQLREALNRYRDDLKRAPWDDDLWTNLKVKMKKICDNSKTVR